MVQLRYRKIFDNNRMFPSKSMVDCVGEASRFVPTIRMDGDTSNTYSSPFQTPIANRYSSSTDSTSPESYYNTPIQITQQLEHRQRFNTPTTYENRHDSQPIFHDSPTQIFESPLPNFNSHPNYTAFDRNLTGYDTNTAFNSFPVFEPRNYDQGLIGDTPFHLKRQRAIVGRKILGCHSRTSVNEGLKSESNFDFNIWQPMSPALHTHEKTQMQYELFPSNEKSYEFQTPKKSTDYKTNSARPLSPTSSVMSSSFLSQTPPNRNQFENWSPIPNRNQYENWSPNSNKIQNSSPTEDKLQNLSPTSNMIQMISPNSFNRTQNVNMIPFPEFKPPYNPSLYAPASSSQDEIGPSKICMFCRKNGETPSVYMNHCVKEKIGNKYIVACPILRALVCMTCGASGDDAHTITYCPVLRSSNNGKPLQSTTITLKNTRVKSNDAKRMHDKIILHILNNFSKKRV